MPKMLLSIREPVLLHSVGPNCTIFFRGLGLAGDEAAVPWAPAPPPAPPPAACALSTSSGDASVWVLSVMTLVAQVKEFSRGTPVA